MHEVATNEKIDPLTRIQEEIKEVVRREQEYHRQLTNVANEHDVEDGDGDDDDVSNNNNSLDRAFTLSPTPPPTQIPIAINATSAIITTATTAKSLNNNNDNNNMERTSTLQQHNSINASVTTTTTTISSNTPSLASSVNSKEESLDEHHSDDSGISANYVPSVLTEHTITNNDNNSTKSGEMQATAVNGSGKELRYIGPNYYGLTPKPPQQKLMTRTVSTPHLAAVSQKPRQFNFNPAQKKGVMQRFFASRGKMPLNGAAGSNTSNGGSSNSSSNMIYLNGRTAAALYGGGNTSPTAANSIGGNSGIAGGITPANTSLAPPLFADPAAIIIPTAAAVIERDAEGRPVRPGYVPVELKIQRELKDLKSRETELKKIRKIRQSHSDLLAIDNDNVETDGEDVADDDDDDENDSDVEHCYGPGRLRNAKSIGELCDGTHSHGSISPRATPSPDFYIKGHSSRGTGMRPAMSLAQLCDLDPEEAPSSHRLIAQWESLIQQNA